MIESPSPETETPAEPRNEVIVDGHRGIMTIVLQLHVDKASALCLGSLEIAKDMVKGYIGQRAQQLAANKPHIIRPGLH